MLVMVTILLLFMYRFWSGNPKVHILCGGHFGSPVGWRFSVCRLLCSDGRASRPAGASPGELGVKGNCGGRGGGGGE